MYMLSVMKIRTSSLMCVAWSKKLTRDHRDGAQTSSMETTTTTHSPAAPSGRGYFGSRQERERERERERALREAVEGRTGSGEQRRMPW